MITRRMRMTTRTLTPNTSRWIKKPMVEVKSAMLGLQNVLVNP